MKRIAFTLVEWLGICSMLELGVDRIDHERARVVADSLVTHGLVSGAPTETGLR